MNNENNFNNNNITNNNNVTNNDLPKTNDNTNNFNKPEPLLTEAPRPQIEIPQAYYDQKKATEEAKEEQLRQEQINREQQKINNLQSTSLLITLIVFGLLTYACIYFTLNKNENTPVIMLAIIVIASIFSGIKNKKKSNVPDGILAGGILCAAITFVISMIKKENVDLWTYYALASGVIAILGYIIAKLITMVVVDGKNIKALQTIGVILVLAAIIGTPIYLKQKYPEEFAHLVFHKTREIVAESEEDFIIKTLKNRYGQEFTCGNKKTAMDYVLHKMVSRYMCVDEKITDQELSNRLKSASYDTESTNYVTVLSIPYNENELEYIIEDNYLDNLYLDPIKTQITNALSKEISDSTFKISLYPNGNCLFVGDCVDCDEYFAVADNEEKLDVRFNTSTNLDYSKELNMTPLEFMNKHEYKYIINIIGNYSTYVPENNAPTVAKAINVLNSLDLQNNYGFEISLKSTNEYNKEVYKVIGKKSDDQKFKDPQEISVSQPVVSETPEISEEPVISDEKPTA